MHDFDGVAETSILERAKEFEPSTPTLAKFLYGSHTGFVTMVAIEVDGILKKRDGPEFKDFELVTLQSKRCLWTLIDWESSGALH
jgi:hypothetical protein